jgi:hypothetical protein
VRLHLSGDPAYQRRLVCFIENHDEPRAAETFPPQTSRAAAVVIVTLPGPRLLHDGQFGGRHVKLPVQLGRRPDEPEDADLEAFYRTLLGAVRAPVFREGGDRHLIVVNLSGFQSQARVRLPWDGLAGRPWRLRDALSESVYDRDGDEMHDPGLYVDLAAWGHHRLTIGVDPRILSEPFGSR